MGLKSKILSDDGQYALRVFSEGEIGIVQHTHPPEKESRVGIPYRDYFTLNGLPSGSTDMRVDGSSLPVDFYISGSPDYDRYIKFISIKLADPGARLQNFGALAALTNGVEFSWNSQILGTSVIHDGIKDNLEFFRLSEMEPVITDLSGAGADSVIVQWDLAKIFGSPWGVKLGKATTDRLTFCVKDDLSTGLAEFNIIGHGTII